MADVTEMLEQDHREAEELFQKIKDTNGAARAGLVTKLADALKLHMQVEEDIVYPAIARQVDDGEEMVKEARTEHEGARKDLAAVESCRRTNQDSTVRSTCSKLASPTTSRKKRTRSSRGSGSPSTPVSSRNSARRSRQPSPPADGPRPFAPPRSRRASPNERGSETIHVCAKSPRAAA